MVYIITKEDGSKFGEFSPGGKGNNYFGKVAINLENPQKEIKQFGMTATLVEPLTEDYELESRRQEAIMEDSYNNYHSNAW